MNTQSDKLIGIKKVEDMVGKNRMTLWRWYNSGKFPKPTLLNSRNMWKLSVVQKWINQSMAGIVYHD